MSKGELTREAIIEKAAQLYNTKGYAGGSMSELMKLTGLKKGGIYNHFDSKEALALEAFDYAVRAINRELYQVVQPYETAVEKLVAIIDFYRGYALNPTIEGGCPILNTAVEVDDTNPVLQERVQRAYSRWMRSTAAIIEQGMADGEFKADVRPQETAVLFVGMIEGGIVLTRGFGNAWYMNVMADQLVDYIEREMRV